MNRRYVTTDVFTNTRFAGNPLAVVLDAEGLSSRQMQKIAAEFGYAETTFVLPPKLAENTARIRIFTPKQEMPFAGHPNIGTAFVLAKQRQKNNTPMSESLAFEQIAGTVSLTLLKDQDSIVGAELVTPKPFVALSTLAPLQAARCLSLAPEDIQTRNHNPQFASVGMPFLIVEATSRAALKACAADKNAFNSVLPRDGASAIYAYTSELDSSEIGADVAARMFTSRMTEDSATGGAAAALSGLISTITANINLELRIAQGTDIGRPSFLHTSTQKHADGLFVKLGGNCVSMMEGSFFLEGEDE